MGALGGMELCGGGLDWLVLRETGRRGGLTMISTGERGRGIRPIGFCRGFFCS